MRKSNRTFAAGCVVVTLAVLLGGCAAREAFRTARELDMKGDYDGAVMKYMEAVKKDPTRQEYRVRLDATLASAAWKHLETGRKLMKERQWDGAAAEFRKAHEYDKTLVVAETELTQAERMIRAGRLVLQADDFIRNRRLQQASSCLDEALLIDPENARAKELLEKVKATPRTVVDGVELDMSSNRPITLKFKETDIKDAFNILSKLTGVNFILDGEIKKQSFTFELIDVSFPQALELILQTNKLGKKVINAKTILIYSKGKDGEKQFADQVIQTFYLSNIDAKKAVNLLRTMLQLRRIYVHEELNAIVVRDTAEVIKLSGQLLEAADRADAEVMFDLELIEVNHTDELDFGPKLSTSSVSVGLGKLGEEVTTGTAATATAKEVIVASSLASSGSAVNLISGTTGLKSLKAFYSLPTLTFDFLKTRSDSELLANPKIRVKNREKAKIMVGTKEPIISATINGENRSDTITYADVGVKLDVEPTIQLDDTVLTKITLEVSSAEQLTKTDSGSIPVRITTTNAQSALTLRDGERTIIGGLVRDDKSKSRSGIAFISDLPLIGPLLTSHSNTKIKREILLSITPHIIQNVIVPGREVGTLWSGAEEDLKAGPIFSSFTAFDPASDPVAPAADVKPAAAKSLAPSIVAPPPSTTAPPVTPAAGAPEEMEELEDETSAPEPETPLAATPPQAAAAAETSANTSPEVTPPPAEAVSTAEEVSRDQPTETLQQPEVARPAETAQPAVAMQPAEAAKPVEAGKNVELPAFEIPPSSDGTLSIQGPATVKVGENVTLEIRAKGVKGLYSVPLFVVYDQTKLELVKGEEGDFLKQGGAQTVFTTSRLADRGEVIVGYKQGVGGVGVSGDGLLFRMIFRAKAPGASQVLLDRLNLRTAGGTRLKVESLPLNLVVR